jgi:anti-sigma regulatory factor (Ser/Thr protein kinase)
VSEGYESWARSLLRTVAISIGTGAVCGALFTDWSDPTLAMFVRNSLVSLTYASLIGLPATVFFRLNHTRIARLRPLRRWTVNILALLVIAIAGSLAAGVVFMAFGMFDSAAYWLVFRQGVTISILISFCFTAGAFTYDHLLRQKDDQLARALQLGTEARLSALTARIHPHFLFNTLNSISALVTEDPKKAEAMLERLASLLRFILDSDRRVVSLGQELAVVRDYLEIESTRFGDRLRWNVEVAPGLEPCEVPPLSVQTLVENSIKHAIAPRRAGGEIRVAVRRHNGALELGVWDDGPGFTATELTPGHGLDNLRQRLASLYGAAGHLAIERASDGTEVTVTLPARAAAAA